MSSKRRLLQIEDVLQKAQEEKLSEIFPKALTIAKLAGDKDLEKWILLELSGYVNTNSALTDDVLVPAYRKVPGQFYDKFDRPFVINDPEIFKAIGTLPFRDGVSELEIISENSGNQTAHNPIINMHIKKILGVDVNYFVFNGFSIKSVITEIRTKLIDKLMEKRSELLAGNDNSISSETPLALSNLHPSVQKTAGELFSNGHYRQSILDTYIAIVEGVKAKSGRFDLDNTPLMQTVFSAKSPILIISEDQGEQQGFMMLFSGAVMAIRNPKAHRLIDQNDPQRTLEWLSFASVLFRVLDDSKVIT